MPCRIKIKSQLVNLVDYNAQKYMGSKAIGDKFAKQLNTRFTDMINETLPENLQLPEQQILKYFINRDDLDYTIDITEPLISYYEGQELLRQENIEAPKTMDPLMFEINQMKMLEAKLGEDIFIPTNIDDLVEGLAVEGELAVATALAEKFKRIFGVDYAVVTPDEATAILNNSEEPYDGKSPAFFYNKTVYFIKGKFTLDSVLHEYAHPFVRAIELNNPELFENLYLKAQSTPEFGDIYSTVKAKYRNLDEESQRFKEEVIVTALTLYNQQEVREMGSSSEGLKALIENILYALKQVFKLFGATSYTLKGLSTNTTLKELSSKMIYEDTPLDFSYVARNIAEYQKEYNDYVKALQNVEAQSLLDAVNRTFEESSFQLKVLQNSPQKLREALKGQEGEEILKKIREYVSPYKTIGTNITDEDLTEIITAIEQRDDDFKKMALAFVNSINEIDVFTTKIQSILKDYKKSGKSLTNDGVSRILYFKQLLERENEFLDDVKDHLSLEGSNDLLKKILSIQNTSRENIREIKKQTFEFANEFFKDSTEYMQEGIQKNFVNNVTKILKDEFSQEEIDTFIADIKERVYNGQKEYKVEDLKLSKTPTKVKYLMDHVKTYAVKSITPDVISDFLTGYTQDLGMAAGIIPTAKIDDMLGSLFTFVKTRLNDAEQKSYKELNTMMGELEPLLKDAGWNPMNTQDLGNKVLFEDSVAYIDPKTNEVEEYKVLSFIDKFKNWRYDSAKLAQDVENAKIKGDKEQYRQAVETLFKFNEDYMHRPYKKEVYDVKKIWTQDNYVFNPATGQQEFIPKEVAIEAYLERQKLLEEMSVINNSNEWMITDDWSGFTAPEVAKKKYDSLFNLFNHKNEYKTGEELQKVLIRRYYREQSSKFYETDPGVNLAKFQRDYDHYVKVVLAQKNITPDETPEEFKQEVQKYLDKHLKISYTADYYTHKRTLMERLKVLGDKAKDKKITNRLNDLYEMRSRMVNRVTDKDGIPDANNLMKDQLTIIKDLDQEIIDLTSQIDIATGLTKDEAKKLKKYESLISKQVALTSSEQSEYASLLNKSELQGLSKAELALYRKTIKELSELDETLATPAYYDTINDLMNEMGLPSMTNAELDLNLEDPGFIEKLKSKSIYFTEWFNNNHVEKEVFNTETKKLEKKLVRTRAWSYTKPLSENYYKKTTIKDPYTGEDIVLKGVPVPKYTYPKIKEEYMTLPKDKEERKKYIGTVIDNRGNYLPREYNPGNPESAVDNKYVNEQYYSLKAQNSPEFKLLEKLKQKSLEFQDGKAEFSKLYYDLPRFRQRSNIELVQSGKTKTKFQDKVNAAKTWGDYLKSMVQKKEDDAQRYNLNFDVETLYIPTDLKGSPIPRIPVQGLYKIELSETSRDVLRSLADYMYSLNEHQTLAEIESPIKAVLNTLEEPENAIKNLGVASKNLSSLKENTKRLIPRSENKRLDALQDYVNRTFYGIKASEFQQDNPWATKVASILMGGASRAFYALNMQSSLKNRYGMTVQKMIEAAGGEYLDAKSVAEGKFKAGQVTWELGRSGYYSKKTKSLDVQLVDAFDMSPGKARQDFSKPLSRTVGTDILDGAWAYADRKLLEANSSLELAYGMLYFKKIDQKQKDGSVIQIPYAKAFEVGEDGIMNLKPGINPEYGNKYIDHVVEEGDTLDSIAAKYNLSVEELKSKNKLKTDTLNVGDELIISRNKYFNDFKLKLEATNNRLNGLTSILDSPLAEKYLVYNIWSFSRKFIPGMFLSRFQMDLSKNNRFGDVYDWNEGTTTRGFYIDAISSLRKTLKDFSYYSKFMTPREKVALKKMLAEGIYLTIMALAIGLIFGYDEGDEDRFDKMREREENYGALGWMANHVLYQLIMVKKENSLFNPALGAKDWIDYADTTNIVTGPTIAQYYKILGDMFYIATGDEKAAYKQDVGPYTWQEKGHYKLWNHLGGIFGFSGKNVSPIWAIKKNEMFSNLQ